MFKNATRGAIQFLKRMPCSEQATSKSKVPRLHDKPWLGYAVICLRVPIKLSHPVRSILLQVRNPSLQLCCCGVILPCYTPVTILLQNKSKVKILPKVLGLGHGELANRYSWLSLVALDARIRAHSLHPGAFSTRLEPPM